jgi:DnaJ-class molecular chaperone
MISTKMRGKCPDCEGYGYRFITTEGNKYYNASSYLAQPCTYCKGTGYVTWDCTCPNNDECEQCQVHYVPDDTPEIIEEAG